MFPRLLHHRVCYIMYGDDRLPPCDIKSIIKARLRTMTMKELDSQEHREMVAMLDMLQRRGKIPIFYM